MNRKTLLIRHGESEYNIAQKRAKNSEVEVQLEFECQVTKYSPDLIDAPLTDLGIQQCLNEDYSDLRIETVVVSPLMRALQTAHYLFRDHPNNPRYIVEPYMREMQMSSCDIGGRLIESIKMFPHMDFSILKHQNNMWTLDYTYDQNKAELARQYVYQNTQNYFKDGPRLLCDYLASGNKLETFEENHKRVDILKTKLTYEEPFVCVSHSRTIHALTGVWAHNCKAAELLL